MSLEKEFKTQKMKFGNIFINPWPHPLLSTGQKSNFREDLQNLHSYYKVNQNTFFHLQFISIKL